MPEATLATAPSVAKGLPRRARVCGDRASGGYVRAHLGEENWWTGNGVETRLESPPDGPRGSPVVAPAAAVRAQLPSLQRRLVKASPDPAHDPQLESVKGIARTGGDLSDEQRDEIRAAHERVRVAEDDHSEARAFRNNLLLWSLGLSAISVVLASIQDSGFDYLAVGAGAGMLTTALAWRSLTQLSGPYAIDTAQALLKVPAGAVAALLGVILVRSRVVSGVSVDASTAYGYAVLFGVSQQALTQVVDNAAKKIGS
jgi:hypothetical protein